MAEAYYSRGFAYGNLGNYQQAIKDFTMTIELKPDYAKAYYNRGIIYIKLGNYQQAIEDIKIAARRGLKPAQDALLKLGEQW